MARDEAALSNLNPSQREAVQHVDGPLLIVAGPGSGKTRVITHRIAYLVQRVGVRPQHIAAVTFTNRAAREMRSRIGKLLNEEAHRLFAGTFHSLCARILRREGEAIRIPRDFVIMDDDDQIGIVKQAMEAAGLDPKRFSPRGILSAIGAAKSKLLDPEGLAAAQAGSYDEIVRRVYAEYQSIIERNQGLDFDDLLLKAVRLFRDAPRVLERYQERTVHLMVDEFQDTNAAQYEVARQLAGKFHNLAVVGDPDQSIYSWRNADIRNILSFKNDFPGTKIVRLSQNYRSTKTILQAAQSIIRRNSQRIENPLTTDNSQGVPICIAEAYNEEEESQFVVAEALRLVREEGMALRDCVVAYRINAQSRALEDACIRSGAPYKIIGGIRFYQRKEIKDIVAYLRLVQSPYDEVSLVRVINTPARGIGQRTVSELLAWASAHDVAVYEALQTLVHDAPSLDAGRGGLGDSPFNPRQQRQLAGFLKLIEGLRADASSLGLPDLIDEVMERSGYRQRLIESDDETDAEERLDNIRELRGVTSEFDGPAIDCLPDFIESVALSSPQDDLADEEQDYLTLITLHQIKGLEYPVVFITGMEEGLLPHSRSMDSDAELEEERRLLYVGMTRAEKRLYLLRAARRAMRAGLNGGGASRFLRDVPFNFSQMLNLRSYGAQARYAGYGSVRGREFASSAQSPQVRPSGAPQGRAGEGEVPYAQGDKVAHAAFGRGIVVSCAPRPGDYEITVAFQGGAGIRRLLHSYGKLERVVS